MFKPSSGAKLGFVFMYCYLVRPFAGESFPAIPVRNALWCSLPMCWVPGQHTDDTFRLSNLEHGHEDFGLNTPATYFFF